MEFTVFRQVLIRALGHMQSIVEKRATLPILMNVKIEVADDLILSATNVDLESVEHVAADITLGGKTTVPVQMLYDIVRKLPDDAEISFKQAFIVGIFQLIAAIFPGTSRSGATIIGGLMLGISRTASADFTFILAIPVMAGSSLVKLLKYGSSFTSEEIIILATGMIVAFVVSVVAIRFLLKYIKKQSV